MEHIVRWVGNRVKMLRLRKGLTQAELAKTSALHVSWIIHVEKGHRSARGKDIVPSILTIARIAKALGVTLEEFFVSSERRLPDSQDFLVRELHHALKKGSPSERRLVLDVAKKVLKKTH